MMQIGMTERLTKGMTRCRARHETGGNWWKLVETGGNWWVLVVHGGARI